MNTMVTLANAATIAVDSYNDNNGDDDDDEDDDNDVIYLSIYPKLVLHGHEFAIHHRTNLDASREDRGQDSHHRAFGQ